MTATLEKWRPARCPGVAGSAELTGPATVTCMTATVGVLARFEFRPGRDQEISRFFADGRAIVEGQPGSTCWYAFRLGPTSYGAFAAFASDADRDALLAAGGPKLSAGVAHLFATPPTFDKLDIVESRPPRP
jgi:hypothetical protein